MAVHGLEAVGQTDTISTLIKHIHVLERNRLAPMFEAEGLTATQHAALLTIWAGRSTCAEIARDLSYDKGAMTRLVSTLEAQGWVVRARDSYDRRLINLELTDDGKHIALRVRGQIMKCWSDWLQDWNQSDVEMMIASLGRLKNCLAQDHRRTDL